MLVTLPELLSCSHHENMISITPNRDPVHSIQHDVSQGEIKIWKLHQYLFKFSLQPPTVEEKKYTVNACSSISCKTVAIWSLVTLLMSPLTSLLIAAVKGKIKILIRSDKRLSIWEILFQE